METASTPHPPISLHLDRLKLPLIELISLSDHNFPPSSLFLTTSTVVSMQSHAADTLLHTAFFSLVDLCEFSVDSSLVAASHDSSLFCLLNSLTSLRRVSWLFAFLSCTTATCLMERFFLINGSPSGWQPSHCTIHLPLKKSFDWRKFWYDKIQVWQPNSPPLPSLPPPAMFHPVKIYAWKHFSQPWKIVYVLTRCWAFWCRWVVWMLLLEWCWFLCLCWWRGGSLAPR